MQISVKFRVMTLLTDLTPRVGKVSDSGFRNYKNYISFQGAVWRESIEHINEIVMSKIDLQLLVKIQYLLSNPPASFSFLVVRYDARHMR